MDTVNDIINSIPSIGLEELAAVDFDGRIDTKFIFPSSSLIPFLNSIKNEVFVLAVNNEKQFHYENLYFDTNDFSFFKYHHAGRGNRMKIRARKYSEHGPFFLEIKRKNNKGITLKERLKLPSFDKATTKISSQFLVDNSRISLEELPQRIHVNYSRYTFANRDMTEKFTLDVNLHSYVNGHRENFDNLIIAEVKQSKFSNKSIFVKSLKDLKIYPQSFSKYCASIMRHHQELKKNRFNHIHRKLKKIKTSNGIV